MLFWTAVNSGLYASLAAGEQRTGLDLELAPYP
jgi:hypothetical protein